MNLNHVELAGHLGTEPEFRSFAEGKAMAILSVATNEKWGKGEDKHRTDWHRVVAWGTTAEFCRQYLRRGSPVFLKGQLRSSVYEKEGQKHFRTEVHVVPGTIQILLNKPAEMESTQEAPIALLAENG